MSNVKKLTTILVAIILAVIAVIASLVVVLTDGNNLATPFNIEYTAPSYANINFTFASGIECQNITEMKSAKLIDGYVQEPELPKVDNYMFLGWYKDASYTNKLQFPYNIGDSALTVYPKMIEGTIPDELMAFDTDHYELTGNLADREDLETVVIPDYYDNGNGLYPVTDTSNDFSGCFNYNVYVYIGNNITSTYDILGSLPMLQELTIGRGVVDMRGAYALFNLSVINYNATRANDLPLYVYGEEDWDPANLVVNIGYNVEHIPGALFERGRWTGNSVASVNFEDNSHCKSIGKGAFYNCTDMTSVNLGNNTSGWWVSTDANATSGNSINVTNTATNATNLATTYKDYYWFRT